GASISAAPRASTAWPSSRVTAGLTVLISTHTAPGRSPATTPSEPRPIARSAALSVTLLKTVSVGSGTARGGLREREAGGDERPSFLGCPVVAHDAAAGVEQPLGHAATHRAQPDETDGGHQPRASSATAIALISSLHRGCVARRETSTVVVVGR